jgi:hypothetical protein
MTTEEIEQFLLDNGLSSADIKIDTLYRQFVELRDEEGVLYKHYL